METIMNETPAIRTIPHWTVDLAVIVLIMGVGGVCAYPSHGESNFLVPEVLSSNIYSQCIGSVLLGFGLWHIVNSVRSRLWKHGNPIPVTFAFTAMFMLVVYGLAFAYIGFYTSTIAFIFLLAYFLTVPEERSIKGALAFSLGTIVAIALLFQVFKIYIPPAWLF